MLETRQFIKIQINFLEKIHWPIKTMEAKSLAGKINAKELGFLFLEQAGLLEKSADTYKRISKCLLASVCHL